MFTVSPKTDCPHVDHLACVALSPTELFDLVPSVCCEQIQGICQVCESDQENWLCLQCAQIFCSRYVNGHMHEHNEQTKHPVAFSMTDASFWCYDCDSYITTFKLRLFATHFSSIKFPEELERMPSIAEGEEEEEHKQFSRSDLVAGLAAGQFKRIAVLTGAGISVAAGIPDFRSPVTGLYAQVAALGLAEPESIFNLDFFRNTPQPFYTLAGNFLTHSAQPVKAHHFIRMLQDKEVLLCNFTQNIDGLELAAGVHLENLVQAHGHMRSVRCIECGLPGSMEAFLTAIAAQKVLYCEYCNPEQTAGSQSLIKPDVVFFGEKLPESFRERFYEVASADLVIVMGTALKVYPFAFLLTYLAGDTPIVLINRENPGIDRENFLFLAGDIEETIDALAKELDWELGSSEKA